MTPLQWALVVIIILFASPSTMYFFIFIGIFKRDWASSAINVEKQRCQSDALLNRYVTDARNLPWSEVSITSHDGIRLAADYYDAHSSKTAILIHGYRSTPYLNHCVDICRLADKGYNILAIYQRAHGKSGGYFSTMGPKESDDILKWIDWTNTDSCSSILVYGVSMGSTALAYASENITCPKVKLLVFDCGFTSFYDELKHKAIVTKMIFRNAHLKCNTFFAKKLLKADIKKSCCNSLAKCTVPAVFIHSTNDIEVPVEHSRRCYESCASEKQLIITQCSGHTVNLLKDENAANTLFDTIEKHIPTANAGEAAS